MIRPILTYTVGADDNPRVLREETRRVTDLASEEVTGCIRDLTDTLADFIDKNGNRRGISGLSAPQIGVGLAISVVQTSEKLYVMINPEVAEELGKQRLFRIGCFSLFEYRALVHYNDDIIVKFLDENGELHREEFRGDRSCVIQHEIDHLHGWLLFERLPNKEKDLFIPGSPAEKGSMSVTQRYSFLFNDYTDYRAFVNQDSLRHTNLIDGVRKYASYENPILELGNGPSTASIILGKLGYNVTYIQSDPDMLELDQRICDNCGSEVRYYLTDQLPDSLFFDVVFSSEYLQFLDEDKMNEEIRKWSGRCRTMIIGPMPEQRKRSAMENFCTNNCRLVITP